MIITTVATTPVEETPELPRPRRPVPEVEALSWRWTTPSGEVWELTDWRSQIIKLKGATGAGQSPVEHWWQDSPSIPGSTWNGSRVARGQVFLPLLLRAASSLEFLAVHERFMAALDPQGESVIRVTHPGGSWRETRCRYESGADMAIDIDPVKSRQARYGITWAQPLPFWLGEPVSAEFVYSAGGAFFPGPPFLLLPSEVLGSAQVTNPGHVEAYPVWRINGPFTSFSLGVGAAQVSGTLTKAAGQWVEIDTDPRALTVLDESGTDRWTSLTAATFDGIPPGLSDLVTSLAGAGAGSSIELEFTPRYRSAW